MSVNIKNWFKKNWKKIVYSLVFILVTFISPFEDAIFNLDFLKEFSIRDIETKEDALPNPILVTPLTEKSKFISGRNCIPGSEIYIYINETDGHKLSLTSDKAGMFYQPIKCGDLKPGDVVWIKQISGDKSSELSPAYIVINSNLHSYYTDREKTTISSIQNIIMLLVSWAVLIIGALTYMLVKEKSKYRFNFFLIIAFFLFILSIYYGISCATSIVSSLSEGVSVSEYGTIDKNWWNQIKLFQQAIFASILFIIWSAAPNGMHTQKDNDYEKSNANCSADSINFNI